MTRARDLSKLLSTSNGKIEGGNLDVSFENITDTGTEGTKVATGTSAQRGSTAGQLRFNSETGLAEYYTGTAFKSIDSPPTVSSIDVTEVDSQAGGNQTVIITGGNFASGATVTFVGSSGTDFNASTVTVDSVSQITAVAPKASFLNAQEPYGVKVTNTSNLSATLADQINVDTAPTFNVASGSLGTLGNADRASSNLTSVTATDADGDTITFSKLSGTLPTGITFNSDGTFSGTANAETSDTTYTFTIRATAGGNTSDRQYTITVEAPTVEIFSYTGSNQTFTAPSGVTSFQIYMWGAGGLGGSSNDSARNGGDGGAGGYVAGTVSNYSAGQTFSILVGQGNQTASGSSAISSYGGGGSGCDNNNGSQGIGGHGGGRSELSIGGGSNTPSGTRILVAGGGGGGGAFYHNGEPNSSNEGGDASYPTGQQGNGSGTVPTGGTQSAGGSAGSGANAGVGNAPTSGSAGIGGYARGGNQNIDIGYGRPGGGGGGYYGGGGGDGGNISAAAQGGGAGSSYYNSSYVSNFAHATGTQTTAPENTNTYYASGIAVGGAGSTGNNRSLSVGGNGRVVIVY